MPEKALKKNQQNSNLIKTMKNKPTWPWTWRMKDEVKTKL
jgi:hypothetical protein